MLGAAMKTIPQANAKDREAEKMLEAADEAANRRVEVT